MTNEKLIKVFETYAFWVRNEAAVSGSKRPDHSSTGPWVDPHDLGRGIASIRNLNSRWAAHINYMCETAIGFVNEGRRDKAMRWLGFIQGGLVASGCFDEVGKHSMPDPES